MNSKEWAEKVGELKKRADCIQENRRLRVLLSEWLLFADDVQPSDAAGEDWLGVLKKKTFAVVNEP